MMPTVTYYYRKGYRYGFNGMEKDGEIKGEGNSYTTEFRQYDPRLGRWLSIDPKATAWESPYVGLGNNPILYNDALGDSVWVYATTLPGASPVLGVATHTFIVVKTNDNEIHYYVYGPADHDKPLGGSQLIQYSYSQDKEVYQGTNTSALKAKILVPIPEGVSSDDFDQSVIKTAESFGNNPEIKYNAVSDCPTTGNCNSSSSTILNKAGVSDEVIDDIESDIPGLNWGFGDVKPWTSDEQKSAVENKKQKETQQLNKIIEKSKTTAGQPKL